MDKKISLTIGNIKLKRIFKENAGLLSKIGKKNWISEWKENIDLV